MAGRKPTYFFISPSGSISFLMPRRAARDAALEEARFSRAMVRLYQFDSAGSCAVEIGRTEYGVVHWHRLPKDISEPLATTIADHFDNSRPASVEMSKSGAE